MASNKPTDELLTALADVGLGLWMLDGAGNSWHAAVYDIKRPGTTRWECMGDTPADALLNALAFAGVEITDE